MSARERVIGPFVFPTRKTAETAIKRILHDSPLDEPLQGDDADLIEALIGCHPRAEEKIGPGVIGISVRRIEYGARGFWIDRIDGTALDFSYKVALDGARSQRETLHNALRFAVRDQVDTFRRGWFTEHAGPDGKVTCPLTGQKFGMGQHAHVDHITPFATLADEFITTLGGVDAIPTQPRTPAGHELANPWHRDLWTVFHQLKADLRVVHQSANLARHRQGDAA